MRNKVQLIGRLGAKAETKHFDSGKAKADTSAGSALTKLFLPLGNNIGVYVKDTARVNALFARAEVKAMFPANLTFAWAAKGIPAKNGDEILSLEALKKAEGQNINIEEASAYTSLHEVEREIIFALSEYPRKVADAGREYSPALIAQYVYDLAKSYNRLFAELSIFSAESPEAMQFRVQLSKAVGETIKKAMALLGIKVPTRM